MCRHESGDATVDLSEHTQPPKLIARTEEANTRRGPKQVVVARPFAAYSAALVSNPTHNNAPNLVFYHTQNDGLRTSWQRDRKREREREREREGERDITHKRGKLKYGVCVRACVCVCVYVCVRVCV